MESELESESDDDSTNLCDLILIKEVSHRKLKPLIAVFKVTYKVRNTAI